MKKLLLIPGLTLILIACNSAGGDKKAELEALKKQEAEIQAKITALEEELSKNDSSAKLTSVSVAAVKAETFKNYIDVQGRVDADENVSLSTEMPGTITKINVKPGDEVSAGQVLAETDQRAINGTVDAVDVKLGQAVAPGLPAIRVINFSNLKVKADVAESYASKVKKGSEVIVYFPDTQDSLVTKVNFVSRAINNASRTFTVEVVLDDKKEYHPNMVARLNINDYQSPAPAIVIPVRTIQKDEAGLPFVFVAENGIAKKHLVKLGKAYRGQAEILEGLKEGEQLVTLGYDLINEGDKIEYGK